MKRWTIIDPPKTASVIEDILLIKAQIYLFFVCVCVNAGFIKALSGIISFRDGTDP